ncbi:MAG TPA: hypothetical protein VGJ31_09610 [Dongiaceae bacterium]
MVARGARRAVAGLMAVGLLATGLAVLVATPARADPSIDELLDRAKAENADNKPVDALRDVQAAYNQLWHDGPLFLTQALFIKEDPQGYGHYDPRADTVFTQKDPLLVYVEPAGYGFKFDGTLYRFGFAVDIEVVDGNGKVRGGAKDFTNFDYVKRTANKEIELSFVINPLGLPPGDYQLKVTINDKVKSQSVSQLLAFSIK